MHIFCFYLFILLQLIKNYKIDQFKLKLSQACLVVIEGYHAYEIFF